MKILVLLVAFALLLVSVASSRTWYIKDDGTGDAPNIQAGIDSAAAADTVLLADGTFTGPGNIVIDYWGKAIVVRSEGGNPDACIIDCEGQDGRFYFQSGEGPESVLEGVTFKNGYTGVVSRDQSVPTIRNCVFAGHILWGMSFNEAGGIVRGCKIVSNSGDFEGGVRCGGPGFGLPLRFVNCIFAENLAVWGGGIYSADAAQYVVIDSCLFYGNEAVADGGAIYWSSTELGTPEITNCTFCGNSADEGGALYTVYSSIPIYNCTFVGNSAPVGSAVSVAYQPHMDFYNCIIAYGQGGQAIHLGPGEFQDVRLACCDIYGNQGGDWTGLEDQLGVRGNFQTCPGFCDFEMEPYDFHLCDESPCAPGNHPDGYDCGLIGAWDVGCSCSPTRTEAATWGTIKALYR